MDYSRRIRRARTVRKWTQARLANYAGVHRSAVAQWEQLSGTKPSVIHLSKIAEALEVSFEWLATGRGRLKIDPAYEPGERTPVGDAQIRGAFLGLAHETSEKEMTHAVMDGVAFAFRDSLEALKDAGTNVTRVMAVGGGTHSELWLKVIATVLVCPLICRWQAMWVAPLVAHAWH